MAITRYPPNTIWLGGPRTVINTEAASEAITPGMLIERFNNSGVWRMRKHTGTSLAGSTYATEQAMNNLGVDTDYGIGDLVEAAVLGPGSTVWALIKSGQTVNFGTYLESAGDGTLKAYSSGVKIAQALESLGAVTVLTRVRAEVI